MTEDHRHRPTTDRDETTVERLVRLAATGPEIPSDGAQRVKDAIRPAWKAEARSRTRLRRVRVAGILLASAATVLIGFALAIRIDPVPNVPLPTVATLAAVSGELELSPADDFSRIAAVEAVGAALRQDTRVRTGPHGRAALTLAEGGSIRLDVDTLVKLASPDAIELDRGAVYVDTADRPADRVIEVRTALGVARDEGTRFEVRRPDDALVVRVRDGVVSIDRDGEQIVVTDSTGVTLRDDGTRSTETVRPDGPSWEWIQHITPPFEIEGRTAASFLAWAGRETGRSIRYADTDVETLARETVLHGDIEGLTPRSALDTVLPGCGLEADRRPGILMIRRIGGPPP